MSVCGDTVSYVPRRCSIFHVNHVDYSLGVVSKAITLCEAAGCTHVRSVNTAYVNPPHNRIYCGTSPTFPLLSKVNSPVLFYRHT